MRLITNELCSSCNLPLGTTVYVSEGYIGTYKECEWCFEDTDRPEQPELITDTFTKEAPKRNSLEGILDNLFSLGEA